MKRSGLRITPDRLLLDLQRRSKIGGVHEIAFSGFVARIGSCGRRGSCDRREWRFRSDIGA
jgi:hypothetical protein